MVTFPDVPLGIFLFCMCVIAIGSVQVGAWDMMCVCHGVCRSGANILIYISSRGLPHNCTWDVAYPGPHSLRIGENFYLLLDPNLSELPRVGGHLASNP